MFTEEHLKDIICCTSFDEWDNCVDSNIIKSNVNNLACFALDLLKEDNRLFKLYTNTSEAVLELERENDQLKEDLALLKLINLSKQDIEDEKFYSVSEALERMKEGRNV